MHTADFIFIFAKLCFFTRQPTTGLVALKNPADWFRNCQALPQYFATESKQHPAICTETSTTSCRLFALRLLQIIAPCLPKQPASVMAYRGHQDLPSSPCAVFEWSTCHRDSFSDSVPQHIQTPQAPHFPLFIVQFCCRHGAPREGAPKSRGKMG